jgi:hypothetical protein
LKETPENAKNSLRKMEEAVLTAINWEINAPTVHSFLLRYQKAAQLNSYAWGIALCISERFMLLYEFLQFSPSLLATAVVSMARKFSSSSPTALAPTPIPFSTPRMNNNNSSCSSTRYGPLGSCSSSTTKASSSTFWNIPTWTATLQYYTGYRQEEITPVVEKIQEMFMKETMNRARIFAKQVMKENNSQKTEELDEEENDVKASSEYFSLLLALDREVNVLQTDLNGLNGLTNQKIDEIMKILSQKSEVNLLEKTLLEKKTIISEMKRKKLSKQQYLTYLPGILEFGATQTEKYRQLVALQQQQLEEGRSLTTPSLLQEVYDQDLTVQLSLLRAHSAPGMMILSNDDSNFSAQTDHSQSPESQLQDLSNTTTATNKTTGKLMNEVDLHQIIDEMMTVVSDIPVIYESVRARWQKTYYKLITCPP